jgi:D-beta-D-heptose 7-phosphate kinase/D-beta-D-heptose 1-phosphate adenosyltransferase
MSLSLDRCLQARRPTVLVVGDVICDVYLRGRLERISPEAPVPVFEGTTRQPALGGAANVAANLHALGCDVRLLGVVGRDLAGRCLRDLLHQRGIADTWVLEDAARPTTEKTRLIAHQQHVLRLDQETRGPLSAALTHEMLAQAATLLPAVDGVICSDYRKGVCTRELLQPLFARARSAGRPIVVDPKVGDFTVYAGATALTPNLAEVEQASGVRAHDEAALARAAELLLRQSQAHVLLVTRGQDGMTLFRPAQTPVHIPARAREVFDVTGAGDTVVAVYSMALLRGLSPLEAARLANTAAGIVVGKVGTAVVTPEELRLACHQGGNPEAEKILRQDELLHALQYHRSRGERLVFTNGCFDLLHVGHVRYLQQARRLGERLIVALNDDASVRELKGPRRPLRPAAERAQLLAALACVDYVTLFGEPTPLELIKLIRPDVLVKGGDYTPDTVVGRTEVEAYGGVVRLIPAVEGVSTTTIINSIRERYGT